MVMALDNFLMSIVFGLDRKTLWSFLSKWSYNNHSHGNNHSQQSNSHSQKKDILSGRFGSSSQRCCTITNHSKSFLVVQIVVQRKTLSDVDVVRPLEVVVQ